MLYEHCLWRKSLSNVLQDPRLSRKISFLHWVCSLFCQTLQVLNSHWGPQREVQKALLRQSLLTPPNGKVWFSLSFTTFRQLNSFPTSIHIQLGNTMHIHKSLKILVMPGDIRSPIQQKVTGLHSHTMGTSGLSYAWFLYFIITSTNAGNGSLYRWMVVHYTTLCSC